MLDRRTLLISGSLSVLAGTEPTSAQVVAEANSHPVPERPQIIDSSDAKAEAGQFLVLTGAEAEFLTAVVDRLIPADDLSPSGSACGVVTFIDRQLAGSYGSGARWYSQGPFKLSERTAGFGNSSPLAPLQFLQLGISDIEAYSQKRSGMPVRGLAPEELDRLLQDMEVGHVVLKRVDARTFFDAVLMLSMEGFFSDPLYGGNQGKASWRMIGFPGLPATYAKSIGSYRGRRYVAEPKSIVDFL